MAFLIRYFIALLHKCVVSFPEKKSTFGPHPPTNAENVFFFLKSRPSWISDRSNHHVHLFYRLNFSEILV